MLGVRLAPEPYDDPERQELALFCATRSIHLLLNAVTLEHPAWLDDPRFLEELIRPALALLAPASTSQ